MKKSLVLLLAPLAVLAASCGGSKSASSNSTAAPASSSAATPSTTAQLTTKSLPGLGPVLVNGQGRTLYTFAPDKAKKVTCVGACAAVWPPFAMSGAQKPTTAGAVNASLISTDPNPSGGQVLTYAGWPLYTYVADSASGAARGQALNLNGGVWYVISPSGTVIKKKATAGAASTSSSMNSSGGGGYSTGY